MSAVMTAVAERRAGGRRPGANVHVAIVLPEHVRAILEGRKTIETRLSVNRVVPYDRVKAGDRILFRESGGGYRASACAARVVQMEALTAETIDGLRDRFDDRVLGGLGYWLGKRGARYATLIWLRGVRATRRGPEIGRMYGGGWVTMGGRGEGGTRGRGDGAC